MTSLSTKGVVAAAKTSAFVIGILAATAATPLAQDAQDRQEFISPAELPPPTMEPYEIAVGDVLEIDFFRATNLNRVRTVGPDGDIYLPLIGKIRAAGRTVDDLTDDLLQQYAADVVEPQITVSVQDYSSVRIYVGGEVNSPGMSGYRGGLTLVQAVMNAGGFTDRARLTEVVLIRKQDDGSPVGTKVNVKDILRKARFDQDVALAPSDIVFVPRSRVANVNLFVAQYIRDNIPIPIFLGFNPGQTQ